MKLISANLMRYRNDLPSGEEVWVGVLRRLPFSETVPRSLILAASFRFETGEQGRVHQGHLDLIDQDGTNFARMNFPVVASPDVSASVWYDDRCIDFSTLKFPHPGRFEFVISVDGDILGKAVVMLLDE